MTSILERVLGAGIVAVLVTQTIDIFRAKLNNRRERKGLLQLLYTEVAQNKDNIEYVTPLLDLPDDARNALTIRGQYVSAEARKAVRVSLAQKISGKDFAVLSDYYKDVLRLEEVVTVEKAEKDRKVDYETSSDTIYKTKVLLEALSKQGSEVQALIQAQVPDVTARDTFAKLAQTQENHIDET